MYKDRNEKLTSALLDANQEIKEIDREIDALQADITKCKSERNAKNNKKIKQEETKQERNISILLDATKNGEVTLVVSYIVSNASWTPLYDVRVFHKENTMQISYFATIKQKTGEDWKDAKLYLTTGMPSMGQGPPKLTVQNVDVGTQKHSYRKAARNFRFERRGERSRHPDAYDRRSIEGSIVEDGYSSQSESELSTATETKGKTHATFESARTATIQSDDVGHKVFITQLDFKPEFKYISTPKLISHAFLKVKAKNESAYALLAGDANIFLDNNYLAKILLQAVSPKEEFRIALGADAAVKVEYKPIHKIKQTSGMLLKSKVYHYHQVIEVKNTKAVCVDITVKDQFPRSCSENIKVTLEDPDIKIPKQTTRNEPSVVKAGNAIVHTNDNAIDWLLSIPPHETKKIDLKYEIECPRGTSITGAS